MIFPTAIAPNYPPVFVLDVSVAASWGIPPQYALYTHRVQFRLAAGTAAIVTANWPVDFADELLAATNRGETTQRRVDNLLAGLIFYHIYLDPNTPNRAWPEILDLARRHAISVRNAAYLELAIRLNLPLATTDASLTQATATAGVPIFTP
jgi:predicted nucleic acid-binding protein